MQQMGPSRPFRALLALPAWRWWVVACFVARLPSTMVVIALVLSGKRLGGYGLGAALAGLYTVAAGLGALWRGRALDRRELRRGLTGELLTASAAFSVTAVLVGLRAPLPVVGGSVVAAGVATSAVFAGYRAFLPEVVPAALVPAAYAIDAVLLEVAFVTGPAAAGGLALLVTPVGVLAAMAAFGATAALLARTLPERHPPLRSEGDEEAPAPWENREVVATYVVTAAVGMVIGLIEAGFAPFAVALGARDGVGGLLSGAYALGSGLGGLVFATRLRPRRHPGRFSLALTLLLGAAVVPAAVAPSILVLFSLMVVAGVPFATLNAAAATYLHDRLHRSRATEGFALQGTAVLLGIGAGNGVAALVLSADGSPRLLYVLAALPPALAVVAVATWTSLSRRDRPSAPL
ncbi:MAG: MFS transporter [Acidimicrobiales bacterium]